MLNGIKAVIFDMDGVIIDSEPLWRKAMVLSFTEIGIPFTENDCRITTGMRFNEVAKYWFNRFNVTNVSVLDFNNLVIDRMCTLIKNEGKLMPGVARLLENLKQQKILIAIGTSSSNLLMKTVITELKIESYFNTLCSAEFLQFGKPHPEVFINCAKNLNVNSSECLVIEDSINGLIAAKAAQMKVLVVPDAENWNNPKFVLADYKIKTLTQITH
jgi:HAD superfamily hydrolase (TIGR01509 family)